MEAVPADVAASLSTVQVRRLFRHVSFIGQTPLANNTAAGGPPRHFGTGYGALR